MFKNKYNTEKSDIIILAFFYIITLYYILRSKLNTLMFYNKYKSEKMKWLLYFISVKNFL